MSAASEGRNAYMRSYTPLWNARNPERAKAIRRRKYLKAKENGKAAAYRKQWRAMNPDSVKADLRKRRLSLIRETFAVYGPNLMFLTIDHVNNDGAVQRRALGDGPGGSGGTKGRAGVNFYRWLKKHGYPRDGYRSMCFNCNCGRARNGGRCPHEGTAE